MTKGYNHICLYCGGYVKRSDVKFCSKECRLTYMRSLKEWPKCEECGQEIYEKGRKFCSLSCYRKHIRKNSQVAIRKCSNCGKLFDRAYSLDRSGNKCKYIFCCRSCYDEFRGKDHSTYYSIIECAYCGKEFERNNKRIDLYNNNYCSFECFNLDRKAEPRYCINCGCWFTPIRFLKGRPGGTTVNKHLTCSNKCLIEFYKTNQDRKDKISKSTKGEKHHNYIDGRSYNDKGFRGPRWRELTKSIKKRDGYTCQKCGIKEEYSVYIFNVHHKVPFNDFPEELCLLTNLWNNLVTLCQSCHQL